MEARVCKYCAGEYLDSVKKLLEEKGYRVSVEGCIGLCEKYECGSINVIAGEKEISAKNLNELLESLEE